MKGIQQFIMAKIHGFVYKWINTKNQKYYIGSHAGTTNDGYIGSGKAFKQAIAKHGIDAFTREILEEDDYDNRQDLLNREKWYLDLTQAYYDKKSYNIARTVGGGHTTAGYSEEEKKELSKKLSEGQKNITSENRAIMVAKKLKTQGGEHFSPAARAAAKKADRTNLVLALQARPVEARKASARKAVETCGKEGLLARGAKIAKNRTPETMKKGMEKRSNNRKNWSNERKQKDFDTRSKARANVCKKENHGRAKAIKTPFGNFGTKNIACEKLNISNEKLNKLLLDQPNDYSIISKIEFQKGQN
jgi:hypothetical protein